MLKIDKVVSDHNWHQKGAGKTWSVRIISEISSVNILGGLFCKLPMVRGVIVLG